MNKLLVQILLTVGLFINLISSRESLGEKPIVQNYLTHGPLVGNVTDTSAVVWMRSNATAQVRVHFSTAPDMVDYLETSSLQTLESSDFTARIRLNNLYPHTTYYYNILVDGMPQLTFPYPQFNTFPSQVPATSFKFIVLNDFRSLPMLPWAPHIETFVNAAGENPDFVILGGDFDHSNPTTLDEKRLMFQRLYSPGNDMDDFIDMILRRFPVAHVWDDHDYGQNNADKTYPYKSLSLQILNEYFPTYAMTQYGDWQKFSFAQADFFLLDSRSQRDPNTDQDDQQKSMLDGDELGQSGQLQWLLDGLNESTALWKFIYSPSVFNTTPGKEDSWASFLTEKEQILDYIRSNGIRNVVILSGDLHCGGIDDGSNAGLPEMLVPAASANGCVTGGGNPGLWSQGIYTTATGACRGYGVISVQTDPDQITLEVKDSLGNLQLSYQLVPIDNYRLNFPLFISRIKGD